MMPPLVELAVGTDPRKTLSLKVFEAIFSRPYDFDIEQDATAYRAIRKQITLLEDQDKFTSEYVDKISQDELTSIVEKGLYINTPISSGADIQLPMPPSVNAAVPASRTVSPKSVLDNVFILT